MSDAHESAGLSVPGEAPSSALVRGITAAGPGSGLGLGSEQLYAVLMSVLNDTLLLPNLAIAEVISRDGLRPPHTGRDGYKAPDWFLGMTTWQGVDLPVARFERLNGASAAEPARRTRIVVINPIGDALSAGRFGLLCDGYPHLVTLNRVAIRSMERRPSDHRDLVLARARVASQETVIPDLGYIERQLVSVLGALGRDS